MKRVGTLVAVSAFVLALSVPAVAANQPPMASSFQPIFSDQQIVGGLREVTVMNASGVAVMSVSIDLGPAPCTCVIESWVASHGMVTDGIWHIGELASDVTAILTVDYAAPHVIAAESSWTEPMPTPQTKAWELRLGLRRLGSFAIA